MATKSLLVVANPYRKLDHDGHPSCVVSLPDAATAFVGARIDRANTRLLERLREGEGAVRSAAQQTRYVFSDEPVLLNTTGPQASAHRAYFVKALKSGALLPADEATAKAAGVPFVPVTEALEAWKARSGAAHEALHGEPAPHMTGGE